ncbi:prolyl oligopeptidase family serine peptidase, partial [bacterium]|nr:prolyl oligopeptidase family serine peptidase [bacterium]
ELRARKGELTQRFGIDRPWDDLADAPGLIRRHRGMVAALLRLLEPDSTLAGDALVSALGDAVEMIASLDHGEDYLASRRNEFWSAYYSPVDGSGQLFTIVVPDDYDAAQRCPLLIKITDGMPTRGRAHTGQYLVVSPRCYGTRSALGLGEYDILRVLRHMKQWYSIDPGRVYAGGYSYGGFATWRIATEHPDLFAAVAPYYGGTGDLKLENLRHVPVFNQHGLKDRSVPIGMSRYGISKLQELGYPVAHKEFPEAAHGIPDPFPTLDWMMARRRVDCPATVTYTCETPENGQAYWLSIRRFIDPHVRARVTARVDGTGHYQMIALALHNVAVLELDVAAMRVERQAGLLVQVGNTFLEQAAPLPERLFVVRRETGWTLTEQWQPPVSTVRPYRPGAAANLCNGEPWMIVYGSRGKQDRADFLRRAAEHLSLLKGARLQTGGKAFPVKADRDVTGDDMAHFNLVLLGGARDNHVVARIADKLPFRINEKNELLAGSREPVSLDGAELRMLYYNPLEPGRLIFLLTTDEPSVSVDDWLTVSRNHNPMTGADGTKRGDQPDMVVQVIAGPIRRQMQFTRDWRWRDIPGSDRHLPQPMAAWRALNKAQLRVMRRMTGADFAFTWGADADDLRFDPDCITRADLAIEGTPRETLLARMTGEELIEVRAKWPGEDEVGVFPVYDKADIDPQRDYDIALPPDFCWRLTAREKNLRNAHAGPDWDVAELWAEIFDH